MEDKELNPNSIPEETPENMECECEETIEGCQECEASDEDVSEESGINESEEASVEEDKTRLFGKKKEKKDKKTEQIEELQDKLKRSMAEFDNFRKRTDKEKSQMYEVGAREVIEKILPIVDNFERAFQGVDEEGMKNPFVEGMNMVFKQLLTALEDMGVKQIEAVGQSFDPNFHNAVMHEENEEYEENVVTDEFQKGYMYKETVIRHSMVKVAN